MFKSNLFQFTNSSTATGTLTYLWNFGDGGTSTATSPVHSYVSAGNYNVALITTNTLGCKDTLKKPVSVYAMPVALTPFLHRNVNLILISFSLTVHRNRRHVNLPMDIWRWRQCDCHKSITQLCYCGNFQYFFNRHH